MKTKLITASDIEAIILRTGLDRVVDQLIERLRKGFAALDNRTANIPERTGIHYLNPDLGLLEWMPACVGTGSASLKLVGYHPANPVRRRLPTVISSICVFDTRSGHMSGILDGTFLTALRTGAMSAVASQLVSPHGRSATLGVVGCGAQAVTQAHALSRVMSIDRIFGYDTDPSASASFGDRIAFLGIPVETVEQPALVAMLEQCDALCVCTSEAPGAGPVIPDFRNRPALHINAVGSDFPGKFELPHSLLRRSFVFPDFRTQAMAEGECQQLMPEDVFEDLAALLNQPEIADAQRDRLTVFDSTGHAFADYVTSHYFLERAEALNLGSDIELECIPRDPKNPYSFLTNSALPSVRLAAELPAQIGAPSIAS